jgi:hypothetical protein
MSLKKAEKLQDVLCIKGSSINAESQKTPAECRLMTGSTALLFEENLLKDLES